MRDVIPGDMFRAIQAHLREGVTHAEGGWDAGSDEEDTLTGDLGGSLRTPGWIESPQNSGRWRVTYKKFRGRGPDAFEAETGADGIFQAEVYLPDQGVVEVKGILFQAKKYEGSSRSGLIAQVQDMEQIAPGGSAVFEFGPDGYRGASGRDIMEARKRQPNRIPHPERTLGDYLAGQFMPCDSGLRGMYYDAVRKDLIVPLHGRISIVRAQLGHRITVQVEPER